MAGNRKTKPAGTTRPGPAPPGLYKSTALALFLIAGIGLLLPVAAPLDRLPSDVCLFHQILGAPCPFCGFTRAVWAAAAGRWGVALSTSPLACALYPLLLLVFLWSGLTLAAPQNRLSGRITRWAGRSRLPLARAGGLLLAANWIFRLVS